ncbi:helix-turn-helix domain-containing protein [Aestuariibaculum suncheonense]|uniref:Helix-turn-helix transcriptional regulator n=1 Tax=Aestuariibaculum suncheonense TaxID=1028745 RepID=A0A8J6QJN6_9FLAO|nr:helix-turn-helix transcriptional regulator [Aestuariibaculum suncheonense]MBD0836352.1 helix-turn-helix transcriptional regulator [Aestuariibaculum suncheonense]
MDFKSVINFFLIAGVVQGFGFNLVTLLVKKKFNKAIIFLNFTVLFISLNNLQRWLIDNGYICELFLIQELEVPWYVLIFPMFYAFTTHFLKIQDKVNDFIKVTTGIFVLEIIIRLCLISYVYHSIPDRDDTLIEFYTKIEEIINLIYCIFLFVTTCLIIYKRHHLLFYISSFDDLNWLKWFIKLGVIVIAFWVIAVIVKGFTGNEEAYKFLRLSSSLLIYWICYQGFFKYNVVRDRISLRSSIETDMALIDDDQKNQNSGLNDDFFNEKHQADFEKIKTHIVKGKLYLDPLLSMESVASDLGMSKSYFSKLINSYSDYNFSDFINSLRVKQAKKFLSNDEFSEYTIVAIGLECGFNSKSTFYSAFKKFTSVTPTIYRNQF